MPTELNRSMAARVMLDSASAVRSAWYAVFQIAPLQDRVGAWPDKYLLATNRFIKMRARRQKNRLRMSRPFFCEKFPVYGSMISILMMPPFAARTCCKVSMYFPIAAAA